MEFGIGMFGDLQYDKQKNTYQDPADRLQEIIAEVKQADELNIDVFAIGQHHRPDYAVSSPETLLAALAPLTQNIKLSSGVNVISSADPVKLYQDYAMIDLLSNQRSEIMAGRGSFIESFPLFGYDLQDYNELFEEKLNFLLEIQQNEEFSWQGKHTPRIERQRIYPNAKQPIPIWIAVGGTTSSVERAGRLGLPIIFAIIGGRSKNFIPLIEYYKENYIKYGHDPAKMQIGVHAHTYLAESQEQVVEEYFETYAASMDRIGRERGWAPYTRQQFRGGMSPEGALVMGSPEDVTQKISDFMDYFGITRFIAHLDVGDPTHQQLKRSIELFGTEVIPPLRTTRK